MPSTIGSKDIKLPRRRTLSVLAVATLAAVAMTSCSTSTAEDSGSPADAPIKIGLSTVFSGPAAQFGQDMLDVTQLYADTLNATGGMDGHLIEIEVADDKLQPSVGVTVTRRLIDTEKVAALVGSPGSSVALAEVPLVQRSNIPMCLAYTYADGMTADNTEQVFRIGPYNSYVAGAFGPYLKEKGYKDIVVFAEDTEFGIGLAAAIDDVSGGDYSVETIQFPAAATDLTPQISTIAARATPPDVSIILSTGAQQYSFFKQAEEAGLGGAKLSGFDGVTNAEFWPIVGDAGVGVVYPTFYSSELELTETGQAFKDAYTDKFDREPTIYMYFQWDCMSAINNAVEISGSIQPADLVSALPDLDFEGTTGQITLTREEGTVHWNQWEDMTVFFKEFTAEGQTDSESTVVYTTKPEVE